VHVEDRVDPVADLEIIHDELRTKDLERARGIVKDFRDREKKPPPMTKEQKEEMTCAIAVEAWLESGKDIRFGDWNAKEVDFLNAHPMITAKPVVYLVNLTEKAYVTKKSKWLPKVHAWVQEHGGDPIIPFSGSLESRIFEMPEDEKAKELEQLGVTSALSKVITAGFKAVQLQYFFTAGEDEVKCWQIRKGTKAPQAAGAIHTDFERGFICAEVMKFDELKELGTEAAVKAAGKYRQEGKGYVVGDSDIIYFKFNVTSSKK
jgi:obg-like ATPase 1